MIYASAAFSRLLVYSSIAFVLLAGIGFAELAFSLMKPSVVLNGQAEARVLAQETRCAPSTPWPSSPCSRSRRAYSGYPTLSRAPRAASLCDQSPADYGVSIANGGTIFAHSELTDWTPGPDLDTRQHPAERGDHRVVGLWVLDQRHGQQDHRRGQRHAERDQDSRDRADVHVERDRRPRR